MFHQMGISTSPKINAGFKFQLWSSGMHLGYQEEYSSSKPEVRSKNKLMFINNNYSSDLDFRFRLISLPTETQMLELRKHHE